MKKETTHILQLISTINDADVQQIDSNLHRIAGNAYFVGDITRDSEATINRHAATVTSSALPLQACVFVSSSELVPPMWVAQGIWGELSQNAPFSWGDNDRIAALEKRSTP